MLATISDREFSCFQELLHRQAGIKLGAEKKALLCGRLSKRLAQRGVSSYGEYYGLIARGQDPGELQVAIDLLTTNETYFFREPKHFQFLAGRIEAAKSAGRSGAGLRIWSAASSTGEESYSIAMVLSDRLGETSSWEIVASDISTRVLERARTGQYPMERTKGISQHYLSQYCLKGTGAQQGTFLVTKPLRQRVTFRHLNLIDLPADLGAFDIVFLRNVLIYFDVPTKRRVVEGVAAHIRPGGYLLIGHSESLNGITDILAGEAPAIYRKP